MEKRRRVVLQVQSRDDPESWHRVASYPQENRIWTQARLLEHAKEQLDRWQGSYFAGRRMRVSLE
jgi:hypothetical protein